MATVTSLTADRMLAIEAASVVDGDVVGDNLILTTKGGTQINAGSVRGPAGAQGPVGTDTLIVAAKQILDVGVPNQLRAGRQLTAADFTNMGLSAPLGLWNLSDLTDASGNGRPLSNKGAVPFAGGINGLPATSAQFAGNTGQGLYINDTGAADPFRIRTGSFGCWFKSPKRATDQNAFCKAHTSGAATFSIGCSGANNPMVSCGITAAGYGGTPGVDYVSVVGSSDVCDDRWHFLVAVHDGTAFVLYVDGQQEGFAPVPATMYPSQGPLTIGARLVDAATAGAYPVFGRVDETFITNDVLSPDQVRNLYCVKIPHALGAIPGRATVNIRRQRRGGALTAADFPAQPLRLHNFSGGSLGDEGSNNVPISNNGNGVTVSGVDGSYNNAYNFAGPNNMTATDAGLPTALAARSFGLWFKTTAAASYKTLMTWGNGKVLIDVDDVGKIRSVSSDGTTSDVMNLSGYVIDGTWHHVVIVEDNAAIDGLKRKAYLDGRMVAASTTMFTIASGGAGAFRLGISSGALYPLYGQIDSVFVSGVALTAEQILVLYSKGAQALAPSPKNAGDHIEALSATDLLAVFDSIEDTDLLDLRVAP